MAMTANPSPIQVIAGLDANSDCAECRGPAVSYFIPAFGVFICKDCAKHLSSLQISVKNINTDIFTDLEVEAGKQGGNAAFRAFAETWEVRDRFVGDRPDEYRERLQAKVKGQTLFSDTVSDSVSSLFSWLDSKFTPVLQGVNEKLSNSETLGKLGGLIESAYSTYETKVESRFEDENSVLHRLKKQVDDVAQVFQAEPADYQPVATESEKAAERDIEQLTH
jgi:hypothetical protein